VAEHMRSVHRNQLLYKCKPIFRCAQAHHFWVFCWLLIGPILDSGKGTLTGLCQYLPAQLTYWTLMRMIRSGQWDADFLAARMAHDVLRYLSTPADGIIHLSGDAAMSGCCSDVPHCTNAVMSQSCSPKNGGTTGRNTSDSL
jgi:hypothetical protein